MSMFAAALLSAIALSEAHIMWKFPVPRESNSGIKDPYPCGTHGFFAAGDAVTSLKPGRQVLEITETVKHRGAPMRIALSKGNDDGFNDLILLTHIPHADNAGPVPYALRFVVDIPDIDCPKCALQALSIMTDKIAAGSCCRYPAPGSVLECNSVYHSCANVRINGTRTTLPPNASNLPNTWTQEGSTWTKNGSQVVYMFDQPYTSFAPNQCSCSSTACSVASGVTGPTVTPLAFPGTTTRATTTSTTKPSSTSSTQSTITLPGDTTVPTTTSTAIVEPSTTPSDVGNTGSTSTTSTSGSNSVVSAIDNSQAGSTVGVVDTVESGANEAGAAVAMATVIAAVAMNQF